MIKQNLHTHSLYCDGRNSIEEMILEAIDKKFTILGFSEHGTNQPLDPLSLKKEDVPKYVNEVLQMKEKYKDQIEIYLGLEQEWMGTHFIKGSPFDYLIGSIHYIQTQDGFYPIDKNQDMTKRIIELFDHDFLRFVKAYYEQVNEQAKDPNIDIIGHLDLIMKFNEDESFFSFTDPQYIKLACDCIDHCVQDNKIIEVNTGAMARGLRTTPYPYVNLLRYIQNHQGKICINSDCHRKQFLDFGYEEALSKIKELQFKEMMVLTPNGFEYKELDAFMI